MNLETQMPGFKSAAQFPLFEALAGRRARRFLLGGSIPDGPFAFTSNKEPVPLTELETLLVLTAAAGNTGWNFLIMRNERYAPHLPNYACTAGGRPFPSAAGFHTTEVFFTDDRGVYFLETRDAPKLEGTTVEQAWDPAAWVEAHRKRIRKLSDSRLVMPPRDPHLAGHNTWVVNRPGSLIVIPVADVAQHMIANLCYYLQNGFVLYDDLNRQPIPGIEQYRHLYDPDGPLPLSFVEHDTLMECTAEISIACYAGMLMLQAMGLGGWMFNGMNPHSVLGTSGDPSVPGLGFRYDIDERWALPNATGLPGVFEGFCPPHYPDMRAAVEALVKRKFGPGGPFHAETPGPWTDSPNVRESAQIHDEEFKACIALQAEYILDRFGKFPGTVPTILAFAYLQAHHLDLDFYDKYFEPGAYLSTHREHMRRWHEDPEATGR